jgi:sec-independent protein translocase protein TatA
MFGLENPLHIAILLLVVLLVFGAKRLPEMGRSLGSGLRGFKQSINGESEAGAASSPASSELPAGERARETA